MGRVLVEDLLDPSAQLLELSFGQPQPQPAQLRPVLVDQAYLATMRFLVWGTMPLGGLIGGALGSYLGVRPALWIAAVGQMFVFLPVFFSPLRTMRELHDLGRVAV